MNLPPELAGALITGILGMIPGTILALWAVRKFSTEKKGIEAEANQDNAVAFKTTEEGFSLRVDGYEKVFKLLMARDEQILHLNNKSGSFELEINRLTTKSAELEHSLEEERKQLVNEREKRVAVEHQRDSQALEIESLRTAYNTQKEELAKKEVQISAILETVKNLQTEIAQMKTSPTATGTYTLVPSSP